LWTCLGGLRDIEGTMNLLLDQNQTGLNPNT
jgi:hypothetical protein